MYLNVSFSSTLSLQRWFLNGQVKCFTGGHLPLALLAILVLLVCLALIPLTAAVATERLRVCVAEDVVGVLSRLLGARGKGLLSLSFSMN